MRIQQWPEAVPKLKQFSAIGVQEQTVLDEGNSSTIHAGLNGCSRSSPGRLNVSGVVEERRVTVCNNPLPSPKLEECLGTIGVEGSTEVQIVRPSGYWRSLRAVRTTIGAGARRRAQSPKATNALFVAVERTRQVAIREQTVTVFLAPQGEGTKVVQTCMGSQRLGQSGDRGGRRAATLATTAKRGGEGREIGLASRVRGGWWRRARQRRSATRGGLIGYTENLLRGREVTEITRTTSVVYG